MAAVRGAQPDTVPGSNTLDKCIFSRVVNRDQSTLNAENVHRSCRVAGRPPCCCRVNQFIELAGDRVVLQRWIGSQHLSHGDVVGKNCVPTRSAGNGVIPCQPMNRIDIATTGHRVVASSSIPLARRGDVSG